MPLLLCRHRVPFYWLIWPEQKTLVAYRLEGEEWRARGCAKQSPERRSQALQSHASANCAAGLKCIGSPKRCRAARC